MKANEIIQYIASKIAPDSIENDKEVVDGKSLYYTSDMGVVIRVPNHRAYHSTFQDRATKFGLPSRILSIVFEDTPTIGNSVLKRPRKKPFTIHEYVYPLWKEGHSLEKWEVDKIVRAIIASGNGLFNDPTDKAEYLPRVSQNPPTQQSSQSNNTNVPKHSKRKSTKRIKESNNMETNVIKLNEQQLKKMIAESVKKVLKESCWYGDEKPFQTILSAANEIIDKFAYTQENDYDDIGDCDGPDITPQIYKWAEDVAYNAEKWLRYNSRYTSINGGEDW